MAPVTSSSCPVSTVLPPVVMRSVLSLLILYFILFQNGKMAPVTSSGCPLTTVLPPVAPIPCSRTRLTSLSSSKAVKMDEMKLVITKLTSKNTFILNSYCNERNK
jgi:hypothetical protein